MCELGVSMGSPTVILGGHPAAMEGTFCVPCSQVWSHLGILIRAHIPTSFTYAEFAGIASFVERIFAAEFNYFICDSSFAQCPSSFLSPIFFLFFGSVQMCWNFLRALMRSLHSWQSS